MAVKDLIRKLIYGDTLNYQAPQAYSVRGVSVTDPDVSELKKIIFSEVSNRPVDKQELEARILLNTALNRANAYSSQGQPRSLTEVFQMPNQYQGYNSPLYKKYDATSTDPLTDKRRTQVNAVADKLVGEIKSGQFTDNTNGAFYYQHKGDKIYYDDRKPLFRAPKAEPLFIQQ